MRVGVACEFSQVVVEAFRAAGHEAWSCDLVPTLGNPAWHYREDARVFIERGWDLLIAHPPCTYLCNSSVWALHKVPPNPSPGVLYREARWAAMKEGAAFFKALLDAPVERIAVENPVMHRYAREIIGAGHTQIVQPWQFGEDASKATGLWLKGLPKLRPTAEVAPRIVDGKKRWGNQTDGGQNKLTPSEERAALRATTYRGIARAMAAQWGGLGAATAERLAFAGPWAGWTLAEGAEEAEEDAYASYAMLET